MAPSRKPRPTIFTSTRPDVLAAIRARSASHAARRGSRRHGAARPPFHPATGALDPTTRGAIEQLERGKQRGVLGGPGDRGPEDVGLAGRQVAASATRRPAARPGSSPPPARCPAYARRLDRHTGRGTAEHGEAVRAGVGASRVGEHHIPHTDGLRFDVEDRRDLGKRSRPRRRGRRCRPDWCGPADVEA